MKKYTGKVNMLHLIEGAKQARGLTVVIDVFRAFSLECYLYGMGVELIRPIGSVEEAFELSKKIKGSVLIGERGGKKCEGFDYGNSPSTVDPNGVKGKIVLHTTSAGTQGIVNASGASKVITASLANAKAVAQYIIEKNPEEVSIVAMGNAGVRLAKEDELCAEYIKSILDGCPMPDIDARCEALRWDGGTHFFDENNQEVFPKEDFFLCVKHDIFPFVLEIERDEYGFISRKVEL